MKIAFFSPYPFSKKLGGTKNRIELSEALTDIGWQTFLFDCNDIGFYGNGLTDKVGYGQALRDFLVLNSSLYHVILYEYDTLPYSRKLFNEGTLFIARPALLHYNLNHVRIPLSLKAKLSNFRNTLLKFFSIDTLDNKVNHRLAQICLNECDIIQVQNKKDASLLTDIGFDENKIVIIPNGISDLRFELFRKDQVKAKDKLSIVFVGTFDFRKGAMDFPFIVKKILDFFPDTTFKLLGVRGLFQSEEAILRFFPERLRASLDITLSFEPNDLPILLKECHIGIFPSYYESFGFGALEMMAAGLPVVSYESSGPSDFILSDLLVPIGDKRSLVNKLLNLMSNRVLLESKSIEARRAVSNYKWSKIAILANEIYTDRYVSLHM